MTTLVFIILKVCVVWSQVQGQTQITRMEPIRWNPQDNGPEDKYMEFSNHWKKEIVSWAKECIFEIRNNIHQMDQINWVAANDLRHGIGTTMGRILEMHRQQVDMYRRMKRVAENRFTWLRPELAGVYPQLSGQNGVVEPAAGFDPQQYNREWAKGPKRTQQDYKPHVYIVALEYITKRETEIEHLIKILTTYTAEEEVARFKPNLLPAAQSHWSVWTGYTFHRNTPKEGDWRRHDDAKEKEEDRKHEEEEAYKAKMREEYYKKNGNKN